MDHRSNRRRSVVALSATLAFVGCASAAGKKSSVHPPAVFEREALEPFHCEVLNVTDDEERVRDQASRGRALGLDLDVDHARFYRYSSPTEHELFAAIGEPCAAARDKARCEAELAGLEHTAQSTPQVFAITTAGDALRLYEGEEVLALLGRVDNPDKAWLALMVREGVSSYLCEDASWHGYRRTESGYVVGWGSTRSSCHPFERVQVVEQVDESGQVTRVRERVVESYPDRCLKDADGRPRAATEPSESSSTSTLRR